MAPDSPSDLPPPAVPAGRLFCFGLGYTAARLAARLVARGWTVAGTARTPEGRDRLARRGIEAWVFDDGRPLDDAPAALAGATHLLASIPPGPEGDPALLAHGGDARRAPALRWAGYLSTPAVYGDRGGALVSEEDAPAPGSGRGRRRLAAERAWAAAFAGTGTALQVFRLAGIYGPGRNAVEQARAGRARIVEKPGQVFNRIHVDDIGTILMASMARPAPGRVYNVADDLPCPSGDVVRHACALLGLDPPEPVPFEAAELSPMARSFYSECKRLDTRRLRDELGVALACPTYREGLAAILREERAGAGR